MEKLFLFQESYKRMIVRFLKKHKEKLSRIKKGVCAVAIVLLLIYVLNPLKSSFHSAIILSLFLLYGLLSFCENSLQILTTVRGFLKNALLFSLIGTVTITVFIFHVFDLREIIEHQGVIFHIKYLFFIIVLSLFWFVFSTFCNTKISIVSNGLLSIMIGVIIQFNSFYWKILEMDNIKIESPIISQIAWIIGTDEYELVGLSINFVLLPIFVMVASGTIGALLKDYWIKVNEKKDISLVDEKYYSEN